MKMMAHKSGIGLTLAMSYFQSGDQIKMIMPMTWQTKTEQWQCHDSSGDEIKIRKMDI